MILILIFFDLNVVFFVVVVICLFMSFLMLRLMRLSNFLNIVFSFESIMLLYRLCLVLIGFDVIVWCISFGNGVM